ncbi:Hypothetical protein Minf_1843 [Methylacidiphilum infernorum V4]|uniref:Uncharacterized protein n=1 Tax=Methylacidiphilum infernorum (isolate V4) TaxID=481448 RepID=B3DXU5_METI4|nr:Hypothetical protein Minf_1843 [Methylacidiphilum infernorum V4]
MDSLAIHLDFKPILFNLNRYEFFYFSRSPGDAKAAPGFRKIFWQPFSHGQ